MSLVLNKLDQSINQSMCVCACWKFIVNYHDKREIRITQGKQIKINKRKEEEDKSKDREQ